MEQVGIGQDGVILTTFYELICSRVDGFNAIIKGLAIELTIEKGLSSLQMNLGKGLL